MRANEVIHAVEIAGDLRISAGEARRRIIELGMSDIGARELVSIQRRSVQARLAREAAGTERRPTPMRYPARAPVVAR